MLAIRERISAYIGAGAGLCIRFLNVKLANLGFDPSFTFYRIGHFYPL
jgi:hypothetical protein